MEIMKYIINKKDAPLLFSRDIMHNTVIKNGKSAGFLSLRYDVASTRLVVRCFGESTSMNISSNAVEDQRIIENFLNRSKSFFPLTSNPV